MTNTTSILATFHSTAAHLAGKFLRIDGTLFKVAHLTMGRQLGSAEPSLQISLTLPVPEQPSTPDHILALLNGIPHQGTRVTSIVPIASGHFHVHLITNTGITTFGCGKTPPLACQDALDNLTREGSASASVSARPDAA